MEGRVVGFKVFLPCRWQPLRAGLCDWFLWLLRSCCCVVFFFFGSVVKGICVSFLFFVFVFWSACIVFRRKRTNGTKRAIDRRICCCCRFLFCFVLFCFFYIFHRWKSRGRRLPKRTEPSQIDPSRDPRKNGSTWLRNGPSRAEWIRAKWIRAKLTRAEN